MYTILIVDDESRQRKGLSSTIAALRPDYTLMEASDGEEAMTLCAKHQFHIVITDIRMPNLDGLQFMHLLGERIQRMKIVLLTGYASFDYAQSAIRLGAAEYLLKPVSTSAVEDMLKRVEHALEGESRPTEEWLRKELLFRQWLNNQLTVEEAIEWEKLLPGKPGGMFIALEADGGTEAARSELFRNLTDSLGSLAPNIRLACFSQRAGMNAKAALLYMYPLSTSEQASAAGWSKLEMALECWVNAEKSMVTIGISEPCAELNMLGRQSCLQALEALDFAFFAGKGKVIAYRTLPGQANTGSAYKSIAGLRLSEAIRAQDRAGLEEGVKLFYEKLLSNGYPKPGQFVERVIYALRLEIEHVRELMEEEEYLSLLTAGEGRLRAAGTLEELKADSHQFILELIVYIEERKLRKHDYIIENCKKYMEEHYKEEVSLEGLAQSFYFNPSYFSSLFKSYTGQSFSDYLLQVRMKHAIYQLKYSEDKVNDISVEIGYKDPSYFIRVFKKMYGVSPGDYRRMTSKI